MAVVNFGSLNIDHTYLVDHFVRPGETMKALDYNIYAGGKGLNQSVALAKAGCRVSHAVTVGEGGDFLLKILSESGADLSLISRCETPQGHAVIQVTPEGENSIFLFSGSNFALSREYIDRVLASLKESSFIVLQNETSNVPYIIKKAASLGHKVVFNAAPCDASLREIDLHDISWLLVNEIEGAQLSGKTEPSGILEALSKANPEMGIVLTLGSEGSICKYKGELFTQPIFKVDVLDTTAAGDTYTGFFVAALDSGKSIPEAMRRASAASAIAVTRKGAAPSVPSSEEVDAFLFSRS